MTKEHPARQNYLHTVLYAQQPLKILNTFIKLKNISVPKYVPNCLYLCLVYVCMCVINALAM